MYRKRSVHTHTTPWMSELVRTEPSVFCVSTWACSTSELWEPALAELLPSSSVSRLTTTTGLGSFAGVLGFLAALRLCVGCCFFFLFLKVPKNSDSSSALGSSGMAPGGGKLEVETRTLWDLGGWILDRIRFWKLETGPSWMNINGFEKTGNINNFWIQILLLRTSNIKFQNRYFTDIPVGSWFPMGFPKQSSEERTQGIEPFAVHTLWHILNWFWAAFHSS